jgi:hypothetical protein
VILRSCSTPFWIGAAISFRPSRTAACLRKEVHAAQEVLEARVGAQDFGYGASQSRAWMS